jgi:hypothetical protein
LMGCGGGGLVWLVAGMVLGSDMAAVEKGTAGSILSRALITPGRQPH